jgi:hypothetical protein
MLHTALATKWNQTIDPRAIDRSSSAKGAFHLTAAN